MEQTKAASTISSARLFLDTSDVVLVIDISDRPATEAQRPMHQATFTVSPECRSKGSHHIGPIQQRPTGPNLSVASPSLLDPISAGRVLPKLLKHATSRCGSLAMQHTRSQEALEPATDCQKGCAVLSRLADEVKLNVGRVVAEYVATHECNVEGWACLERVLRAVSDMRRGLGTVAGTHSGVHADATGQTCLVAFLSDPVELNVDDCSLHCRTGDFVPHTEYKFWTQYVEEVDWGNVQNLGNA